MGGFRLLGPNYTIQSLPSKEMCKCMGYKGEISMEVETTLVNDSEKKLKQLPFSKENVHLGDNMYYKAIHISEDDNFIQERERFRKKKQREFNQLDVEMWTPWDGKSLESMATRELYGERPTEEN